MAAKRLKDVYRGDTKQYKISLAGFDLANDTFYLAFKGNKNDADPGVFQTIKSIHNLPEDDPVNGLIFIRAEKEQTALLVPGDKYWVGFQWVRANGDVKTLYIQQITALQDINITS